MTAAIDMLELVIERFVEISILLLESFGICVLVVTALKSFYRWIRHDDALRLELAEGISLALEFKMGGEVLRTVIVREWKELGILGAIIALRGLLTFLIHWEIRNEEQALEKKMKAALGSVESAPEKYTEVEMPDGKD